MPMWKLHLFWDINIKIAYKLAPENDSKLDLDNDSESSFFNAAKASVLFSYFYLSCSLSFFHSAKF